jgi:hypothetical protein
VFAISGPIWGFVMIGCALFGIILGKFLNKVREDTAKINWEK